LSLVAGGDPRGFEQELDQGEVGFDVAGIDRQGGQDGEGENQDRGRAHMFPVFSGSPGMTIVEIRNRRGPEMRSRMGRSPETIPLPAEGGPT